MYLSIQRHPAQAAEHQAFITLLRRFFCKRCIYHQDSLALGTNKLSICVRHLSLFYSWMKRNAFKSKQSWNNKIYHEIMTQNKTKCIFLCVVKMFCPGSFFFLFFFFWGGGGLARRVDERSSGITRWDSALCTSMLISYPDLTVSLNNRLAMEELLMKFVLSLLLSVKVDRSISKEKTKKQNKTKCLYPLKSFKDK